MKYIKVVHIHPIFFSLPNIWLKFNHLTEVCDRVKAIYIQGQHIHVLYTHVRRLPYIPRRILDEENMCFHQRLMLSLVNLRCLSDGNLNMVSMFEKKNVENA